MIRSRIGRSTLCVAALVLAQCTKPRTELVVTVWSELAWGVGRDVQSLAVTVRRGDADGATRWQQTKVLGGEVGQWRLPLSFGLYPTDATDTTPVWIEVLGCAARDGCVPSSALVVQRAIVSYRSEEIVGLDMWLAARCRGVVCAASEACARETGTCVPAETRDQDVRALPGGSLPVAMDARTDSDDLSPAEAAVDAPVVDIPMMDVAADTEIADVPTAFDGSDIEASADVFDAPREASDGGLDAGDGGALDAFDDVDAPTDVPDVAPDRAVVDVLDASPACTTIGSRCPCTPTNRGGYCSPGGVCNTMGMCAMGSPAGSLVITEMLTDPQSVSDEVGEWFEVFNPGTTPLDLRGVRISNSRSQMVVITSSTPVVVEPTRYAVLARDGSPSTNGGVNVLYAYGVGLGATTLAWSNSSIDAVILDMGSMASEIDRVTYNPASGSQWPRAMGKAKSLWGTATNTTANDLPANWCDAPTQWAGSTGDFGSPGVANPPCP